MFSSKNYGLPKELIEAAKRVHEKQLEEDAGKYAEPRMDPKIHNEKNPAVRGILHSLAAREKKKMNKKLPGFKKTQAEEVQFTEEELAEAFAAFLEENFHVEMLTEEDLDYVFEEEFPQWLEEETAEEIKARLKRAREAAAAATQKYREAERARTRDQIDKAKEAAAAVKAKVAAANNDDIVPDSDQELPPPKNPQPKPVVRTKPSPTARRAPKTDYKTPISTRDPVTGTYQLTDKGRKYVAKTDKKPFGYSSVFGND